MKTHLFYLSITLILIGLLVNTCSKQSKTETYTVTYNRTDTVYSIKYDTLERKVIVQSNREFTTQEIKTANNAEMDSLRLELDRQNIKIKNLQSALQLAYTTFDTLTIVATTDGELINVSDSSKHLTFNLDIDTKTMNSSFTYQYQNNLMITSFWYKRHIFARPELRLSVVNDDKNANITTNTFTVKPKKQKVSVGIGVGYGYSIQSNRFEPQIGIYVSKPIFSF